MSEYAIVAFFGLVPMATGLVGLFAAKLYFEGKGK